MYPNNTLEGITNLFCDEKKEEPPLKKRRHETLSHSKIKEIVNKITTTLKTNCRNFVYHKRQNYPTNIHKIPKSSLYHEVQDLELKTTIAVTSAVGPIWCIYIPESSLTYHYAFIRSLDICPTMPISYSRFKNVYWYFQREGLSINRGPYNPLFKVFLYQHPNHAITIKSITTYRPEKEVVLNQIHYGVLKPDDNSNGQRFCLWNDCYIPAKVTHKSTETQGWCSQFILEKLGAGSQVVLKNMLQLYFDKAFEGPIAEVCFNFYKHPTDVEFIFHNGEKMENNYISTIHVSHIEFSKEDYIQNIISPETHFKNLNTCLNESKLATSDCIALNWKFKEEYNIPKIFILVQLDNVFISNESGWEERGFTKSYFNMHETSFIDACHEAFYVNSYELSFVNKYRTKDNEQIVDNEIYDFMSSNHKKRYKKSLRRPFYFKIEMNKYIGNNLPGIMHQEQSPWTNGLPNLTTRALPKNTKVQIVIGRVGYHLYSQYIKAHKAFEYNEKAFDWNDDIITKIANGEIIGVPKSSVQDIQTWVQDYVPNCVKPYKGFRTMVFYYLSSLKSNAMSYKFGDGLCCSLYASELVDVKFVMQ